MTAGQTVDRSSGSHTVKYTYPLGRRRVFESKLVLIARYFALSSKLRTTITLLHLH